MAGSEVHGRMQVAVPVMPTISVSGAACPRTLHALVGRPHPDWSDKQHGGQERVMGHNKGSGVGPCRSSSSGGSKGSSSRSGGGGRSSGSRSGGGKSSSDRDSRTMEERAGCDRYGRDTSH